MKETQENIPASRFKNPQKSFLQAQSCFFSSPSVTFFLWGQNIKMSIRTCGLPNMEEECRLFSLKNITTTPRNSFHKSCRHTGTRNRHPKTKSWSKNYQRGNQNPDSNLWAYSSLRMEVCHGHLVPTTNMSQNSNCIWWSAAWEKSQTGTGNRGEFSINSTFQRSRRPVGYQ